MTARNEVFGRPPWAAREPLEMQRLIVEHKLTQLLLQTLREFATAEFDGQATERKVPHSIARAIRTRGLGEITGTWTPGSLDRRHPTAAVKLNDDGWTLARSLVITDECPMGCHEASVPVARGRWDRQKKAPRAKNPRHHPKEWDE